MTINKGFTLIELLSVIVLLAIIAVIATPIVLNIIKDAKISASKRSIENYIDAIELYIANKELTDKNIMDGIYYVEEFNKNIEVNGKLPNDGYIEIKSNRVVDYLLIYDKNQILLNKDEINKYDEWDGTITTPALEDDTYLIYKTSELAWIAQETNNGNSFFGISIKLMNNLSLGKVLINKEIDYNKSKQWIPIGTKSNSFKGMFDGNNYIIKNMYIKNTNESLGSQQGLFGCVSLGGIVKNVLVKDSYVQALDESAIIIGRAEEGSSLENLVSYNNLMQGRNNISTIVAKLYSDLNNAKSINDIIIGEVQVGSISGWIGTSKITNLFSKSSVSGTSCVGGILGRTSPTRDDSVLTNLNSYSNVNGETSVGGIIGSLGGGYIAENLNSYSIVNGNYRVGGISGDAYSDSDYKGIINNANSYSTINASSSQIGGLFGLFSRNTRLNNAYDASIIISASAVSGGFAGYIYDAKISNVRLATIINNLKVTESNIFGYEGGINEKSNIVIE